MIISYIFAPIYFCLFYSIKINEYLTAFSNKDFLAAQGISINDTHGHQAGDKVLQEFAAILKEEVRQSDAVGRFGGEEFIIILKGSHKANALKLAQKIRQKVQNNSFDGKYNITASFGVSTYLSNEPISIEDLVEKVDKALYYVKKNGRNGVSFL